MQQSLVHLRVGGVPEHFNSPWWRAQQEGRFTDLGINLEWRNCPGGSGEMMRALAAGELDLALVLSEGAAVAIAQGVPARIQQWYVRSPLYWGIHVAHHSAYTDPAQLRQARFAISRPGSGSQLMAYVEAQRQGWFSATGAAPDLEFVEVGHLQGGLEALAQGRADVFLWERFTTAPWVEQGQLRRIGLCPTPWPAFALVRHRHLNPAQSAAAQRLGQWLPHYATQYAQRPGVSADIAQHSQLPQDQVSEWLKLTQWADSATIPRQEQEQLIQQLQGFKLIAAELTAEAVFLQ